MNKKYRLLSFFILSFFIGYLYISLVYNGLWFKLTDGLSELKLIHYPFMLILTFYVTLTLHELGHFFAFLFQGIPLRAIYLTVFVFYKDKAGWHFTIKPKLWVLGGGLVIPDIQNIDHDDTYESIKRKFAISLITAPIVTILFMALVFITFIISLIYSTSSIWIGFYAVFTLFTMILSSLYIYTFKLSAQSFYGDFVAYRKMKEDETFALAQVMQYAMFSLHEYDTRDQYFFIKTKEMLKSLKLSSNLFHVMLLTHYIDSIIRSNQEIDLVLHEKIKEYARKPSVRDEHSLLLAYELCAYFYKLKDVERAYQLFDNIQLRISDRLDPKMKDYLKYRTMHIIHLEDHQAFLSNPDNVYIGNSWIFEAVSDPYELLEEQHEKLPFVEYKSDVVFPEIAPSSEQKSDLN
jgi:hypothetical protein